MALLLTWAGTAAPDSPGTRTGGVPLVPDGFVWPTCRTCDGAMQFVAQVPLDPSAPAGGDLLVFLCQNDPGLCDEWDATSGGSSASVARGSRRPADVPANGITALDAVSAAGVVDEPGDYDRARSAWTEREAQPRGVLGQLGGEPAWIQGDETPTCSGCDRPMRFVVQLEEGHDHATAANFGGGGCAYGFACDGCDRGAFLFQC